MKKTGLKRFEAALLIALSVTLCYGTYLNAARQNLTENIIRLHVIAVSDEPEEQELKLRVRDGVTDCLQGLLENAETMMDASSSIEAHLDDIQNAAAALSDGRPVSVEFGTTGYPARTGDGYALPAGEYVSLRVTLGEGEGHNWWGVVFPDLTPDSGDYTETSALNDKGISLIAGDEGDGYTIKFKALEYWDSIVQFFTGEA